MLADDAAVTDMLNAAVAARSFVEGIDETAFRTDRMRQLAIERLLEIIGEAAKRVSPDLRDEHPEVPWRRAAGLRDFITHEYHRIDLQTIWDIVTRDLPDLIATVEPLVPSEPPGS
jgi:uncharacterized protein with HEPN domain